MFGRWRPDRGSTVVGLRYELISRQPPSRQLARLLGSFEQKKKKKKKEKKQRKEIELSSQPPLVPPPSSLFSSSQKTVCKIPRKQREKIDRPDIITKANFSFVAWEEKCETERGRRSPVVMLEGKTRNRRETDRCVEASRSAACGERARAHAHARFLRIIARSDLVSSRR